MADNESLDRLGAELEATWRAMNNPRTTGHQMQRLYARAADLRAEIARLEAARAQQTAEIDEILNWAGGQRMTQNVPQGEVRR